MASRSRVLVGPTDLSGFDMPLEDVFVAKLLFPRLSNSFDSLKHSLLVYLITHVYTPLYVYVSGIRWQIPGKLCVPVYPYDLAGSTMVLQIKLRLRA